MAIQGDLRPAAALFAGASPPGDARDLAEQFHQRFVARTEKPEPAPESPFIADVVSAYQHAWTLGLMGEQDSTSNEAHLAESLRLVLARYDPSTHSIPDSDVHRQLGEKLAKHGYFHLDDVAPPLRDLFLWEEQQTRSYFVQLTDRSRQVRVIFMDGFHSLGWKYFASLGLATTTGWVKDGDLYCVAWAYDTTSENFRVSYLKHEARHLVDYEEFPGLDAVELEYRAKLTELAYAYHSVMRVLNDFTSKAAQNTESPHAMANYRVTRDLYQEIHGEDFPKSGEPWSRVGAGRVNRAARVLLKQSDVALAGRY